MSTTSPPGLFSSGTAKTATVLAAVSALAIGGVLGVLARPDDTTKVVLEPVAKVAQDSWLHGGIDEAQGAESRLARQYADYRGGGHVPDGRHDQTSATLAGDTVDGASAGVYGGTRDTQVCDKSALATYLTAPENAAIAQLWADVLQLEPGQISNYVSGLTGARLRWDTRVTDSGLTGTTTTSWQALLQAGTGVLVDNTGVPRVKCSSGSPLLAPEGVRSPSGQDLSVGDVAQNPGDAWPGLDPAHAVSIQPGSDPLSTLTIVDLDSDDLLQRDVGSDGASSRDVGSGDVQFNLRWNSRADLDIHVVDPYGNDYGYYADYPGALTRTTYYYDGTTSPNGGRQDVDSNVGCTDDRDTSGSAKENVFWPPGRGPAGTYRVYVSGFEVGECDPAQSGSFTLTATIAGRVRTFTGSVGQDGISTTWAFTKP